MACSALRPPVDRSAEATALAGTLDWAATVIAAYTPTPPPLELSPTTIGPITPLAEVPADTATAPPGQTPIPTFLPPPTDPPGLYAVQAGDTLPALALRLRVEPANLLVHNPGLPLTQTLPPGTWLSLPSNAHTTGFDLRLVPDSEVVYSPSAADFDVRGFVLAQPGYLATYTEVVTDTEPAQPGWQIVAETAQRYSVNPRLLLALLEYQSGALTNSNPDPFLREHGLGLSAPALEPGLSHQLGWAGNQLNQGYYGWRDGSLVSFTVAGGGWRPADGRLNAGSFALARLLGLLYQAEGFARATSPDGVVSTYRRLFGDAWANAYAPLVPGGLTQPEMQLPFEPDRAWAFTGGPHPGYGRTLPFAALDFGPPAEQPGCAASPEWVVAVRAGTVILADDGLVELDVGEGWHVVYLHVATLDRALPGTTVQAGQRLGHPSCEGGRATAAHLHLARKYNGEWVPADGYAPFVLSGWVARFGSGAYRGTLTRGDRVIEACACANAVTRLWLEP
jgi:murein DD-endopeptidase MepM/ murein hydrolase activator NlpD